MNTLVLNPFSFHVLKQGWSAALAFAPVRRSNKPKPAQTRLPPGAAVVASLTAAASIHPTATIVQPSAEEESVGWAKKLKAPSMVIDDDINGFRGGKSRKKGKKASQLGSSLANTFLMPAP